MYYLAAILLFAVGIAHSYLGERYILRRLFRRDNLPKLFGGTEYTKNTLRSAWHLTTIAWFGFACILLVYASGFAAPKAIGTIIGITFLVHFAVALLASKGKHLSWPVFLAIGLAVLYVSHT